jgi:hypothetical protein
VTGTLGAFEAFEGRYPDVEHPAIEEDQRAKGLVLRRRRGAPPDREAVEKGRDLRGAHLAPVTTVVKADEVAHPADVGFLRARRVVESPNRGRDGFGDGQGGASGGARGGGGRGAGRSRPRSDGRLRTERETGTEMWIGNWAAAAEGARRGIRQRRSGRRRCSGIGQQGVEQRLHMWICSGGAVD